jgi:carbon storage regulator
VLILTRKKDESIIIDGNIEIQIIGIEEGKVKIGINAPKSVTIHRSEIFEKIKESNVASTVKNTNLQALGAKFTSTKK